MDIKNKEHFEKIIAIIVPIIFLAYGLCKSAKGIDLIDSGYNYGNFKHLKTLDGMWFYSTFLANITGAFLTMLPFGKYMLGMNIYCGIIKCIIPISVYFFMTKKFDIPKRFAFFGEICALGLCWCPVALLYNSLTYLLFTVSAMILISGLIENDKKRLFLAGIVLGLNLFTRLPNICECALILVVIFNDILNKEKPAECIRKSLLCVAGYAAAVIVLLLIAGPVDYINGVTSLMFDATKEAADYRPDGMIVSILSGYKDNLFYIIRTVAVLIMTMVVSMIIPVKYKKVRLISAIIISVTFLIYMWKNMLFDFDYKSFGSAYQIGALSVTMSLTVFVIALFDKEKKKEIKLLSLTGIIVILITPIGSNNGIEPVLNNMFLIYPVMAYLIWDYGKYEKVFIKGRLKSDMVCGVLGSVIMMLLVSAFMYGMTGLFRDADATREVDNLKVLSGMKTNEDRAEDIRLLADYFEETGNKNLLLYGNIPALMYYLDGKPVISSSWPDLDSYNSMKFENEINSMTDHPVIMIGQGSLLYEMEDLTAEVSLDLSEKEKILLEYIKNNEYTLDYVNRIAKVYILK